MIDLFGLEETHSGSIYALAFAMLPLFVVVSTESGTSCKLFL